MSMRICIPFLPSTDSTSAFNHLFLSTRPSALSNCSICQSRKLNSTTNDAPRYGIAGLKSLARKRFAHQIQLHVNSPELPNACQEAYETTVDSDRGLRDIVIQTFRAHPDLALRKDVEMVVRETPGLAFELYRMASGLPVTSWTA